jgi:hypothetical protein
MLRFAPIVLLALAAGCVAQNNPNPGPAQPEHPLVRVQGIDGTVMSGELLNGSVTVDSGQGPLTLLTDHIYSIDFSPEADTVDSASVKVSGRVKEPQFMLRSEHGVFTLMKERLRKIEFTRSGAPSSTPAAQTASETATSRPRQALIIP